MSSNHRAGSAGPTSAGGGQPEDSVSEGDVRIGAPDDEGESVPDDELFDGVPDDELEGGELESPADPPSLTLTPIGVVHSPFKDRLSAPRQPRAGMGIQGTIQLFQHVGYEYALEDLASFRFIWVVFWFHKNTGFRRKVQPPRSQRRRGVFATRSPYRPNPIGLSAVELLGIDGLTLRVQNLDILDGTPVLDLKPYVPYIDSIPEATNGWLDEPVLPADPIPHYQVDFAPRASAQLAFLEQHAVSLRPRIEEVLRLGPAPHPYRRIKANGKDFILAYKAWRIDFAVPDGAGPGQSQDLRIEVLAIRSGYRPSVLATTKTAELDLHRALIEQFG
jgi:tRNA (adenine37-N6)-methyltransferase